MPVIAKKAPSISIIRKAKVIDQAIPNVSDQSKPQVQVLKHVLEPSLLRLRSQALILSYFRDYTSFPGFTYMSVSDLKSSASLMTNWKERSIIEAKIILGSIPTNTVSPSLKNFKASLYKSNPSFYTDWYPFRLEILTSMRSPAKLDASFKKGSYILPKLFSTHPMPFSKVDSMGLFVPGGLSKAVDLTSTKNHFYRSLLTLSSSFANKKADLMAIERVLNTGRQSSAPALINLPVSIRLCTYPTALNNGASLLSKYKIIERSISSKLGAINLLKPKGLATEVSLISYKISFGRSKSTLASFFKGKGTLKATLSRALMISDFKKIFFKSLKFKDASNIERMMLARCKKFGILLPPFEVNKKPQMPEFLLKGLEDSLRPWATALVARSNVSAEAKTSKVGKTLPLKVPTTLNRYRTLRASNGQKALNTRSLMEGSLRPINFSKISKADWGLQSLLIFDNVILRVQGGALLPKVSPNLIKQPHSTGRIRPTLSLSNSPASKLIPGFNTKSFFVDKINNVDLSSFVFRPRIWSLEAKTSSPAKLFEVISYRGSGKLALIDSSSSMRDFSRGVYWVIKSERLPYVASFKSYPNFRYSSFRAAFDTQNTNLLASFDDRQKVIYRGTQFSNAPDTIFLNQNYTDASSRLLRVKQFLVLPISINMTAITTSTDIMHSWFIPNLGLKLDCVPGKMTHHTFIFNIPGVYYGQCAEICGRQHHHMPIKLVLVDWVHFIIYTNHFIYKQWEEVSKGATFGFEKKTKNFESIDSLSLSYTNVYNKSFISNEIAFDYEALRSYRLGKED